MKLPRSINIYGLKVKVGYDKKALREAEAVGLWIADDKIILVDRNLKDEAKMQCFLHECLHALFTRLSFGDVIKDSNEEILVDTIATFLTETFDLKVKDVKRRTKKSNTGRSSGVLEESRTQADNPTDTKK